MEKALSRFENKLRSIDRMAGGAFSKIGQSIGAAFSGIGTGIQVLHDGLELARGFAETILSIGQAAVTAGRQFGEWVVGVASERESALTALRTVLGDQRQAQQVFDESLRIAQLTPFETADVIRDRMQLVLGGFTADESRVLYAAAADVGAALGPERQQILQRAFERIGASGHLEGRVLEELDAAGVGRRAIFQRLAEQMGRRELLNNQRALSAWAEPIVTQMTSDRALRLIVDTIGSRISGGGAVGSFSVAQSSTISGILSNLRSLPHDLLAGLDLENQPGIRGFKRALQDFMALFDGTSDTGRRFRTVLLEIINDLFGGLFGRGESQSSGIRRVFDSLLSVGESIHAVLQRVVPLMRAMFSSAITTLGEELRDIFGEIAGSLEAMPLDQQINRFSQLGESIGHTLGGAIRWVTRLIEDIAPQIARFFNSFDRADAMYQIGVRLGEAIMDGMSRAIGNAPRNFLMRHFAPDLANNPLLDANDDDTGAASIGNSWFGSGRRAGEQFEGGMRDSLEMHSPSRVFQRIGEDAMAGLALGINSNGLFDGLQDMRAELRLKHDVSVQLGVHATGGETGEAAAHAEEIAETVAPIVRDLLRRIDFASSID